jgi:hypothetical protein
MNSIVLITQVVDSASSELGDDSPTQEQDIDPVFRDALEDHTSEHDFIPTTNDDHSAVPDQSGAYTAKRVHPSHFL